MSLEAKDSLEKFIKPSKSFTELPATLPITLCEPKTFEGMRSIFRIILGVLLFVIITSAMIFLTLELDKWFSYASYLIGIVHIIGVLGCLWLTTKIVYWLIPWRTQTRVLRIFPNGASEVFFVAELESISLSPELKQNGQKKFSTPHQLDQDLKTLPSSWFLSSDSDTTRWMNQLQLLLNTKHGRYPMFSPYVQIQVTNEGVLLQFSLEENADWPVSLEEVLVIKR